MTINLKKKKYIAYSHDYGGGHNLFLYLKKKKILAATNFSYIGPSSIILRKNNINNLNRLETIANYSKVFYSLSWNKKIEKYIYRQKKKYKFKTCLIIDGWGNYKSKLNFNNNKTFYPDEIICFDEFSYKIVRSQFRILNISIDNYLLKEINNIKKKIKNKKKNKILYLTSPLIKKNNNKYIINYLKNLNHTYKINVRYHPSEKKKNMPLAGELNNVLKVYGHYSSLLIYCKLIGIDTYSINYRKKDIFKWKKLKIFKNYKIKEIYDKSFDKWFKKSLNFLC